METIQPALDDLIEEGLLTMVRIDVRIFRGRER